MPSQASKLIRATLVNDIEAINIPLEVQRREWEGSATQTLLPLDSIIAPLMAEDVACERISCSSVERDEVMFYLHGGGFTVGSCKTHRDLAARLSLTTGIPVLLVDYRLAPEYPFPAAIEDVTKAYRWLIKSGTQPHQIIMGGDSSGGGLAMSTLLSLRDNGDSLPSAVVLLSPWLDLALTGESLVSRAHLDPLVSQEGLRACAKHYIGDRDPKDSLISPLYADLHSLPPMLIHVGDHELLLSDAIRLADRAQAANVEVKLDVWPEMWHVWHAWAASLPEGQEALNQIGGYVSRYLPQE